MLTLRFWYNQNFIDSDDQWVQWGTATTGNQFRVACAVAAGIITVPQFTLYSTIDAQVSFPQAINISCMFFKGNSSTGISLFSQFNGAPNSWVVPSSFGATMNMLDWATYNEASAVAYPPANYYTADQVNRLIAQGGGGGGGITELNGLTASTQVLEEGTTGSDFNIVSTGDTHTFNLPTASSIKRGLLDSADWTSFNNGGANGVPASRTLTEGAGLAGNTYDLSANRTLAMGTPSTLSVSSLNSASGTTHSHGITSSSNPGAAASLLASDSSGYLQLTRLGIATTPTQPLEVAGNVLINAATANLFLKNTSTGFLSSSSTVMNLQNTNTLRTTDFASGTTGWNISANGDAEFNNVRVRGELAASVFKISEISATAGTFGVFFSASTLSSVFISPGSVSGNTTLVAKNSDAGGMLFAVNDVLRIKSWTGAGISDSWLTVTSRTNNGTTASYGVTLQSGSTSATYGIGTAVVDYGPSGTGNITLSADGTIGSSPNMNMATHAGSPWSTQVNLLRLGNLNGSYGYATDVYGLGTGQYGTVSKSWLTVEQTNGIRIGNNTTTLASWDTLGVITVGQVSASQGNVLISAGQIDIRVNTTSRIRLAADGSGFLANSLIAWDTSGNLTVTGNATIAGWAINTTSLSSTGVYLASGLDIPGGINNAWFGRGATGYKGIHLGGTGGEFLQMLTGNGSVLPYLSINDGTVYRVVIGGLNSNWDGTGVGTGVGMKIWNSSGVKLVEFSNIANIIAGWTITSTRISAGTTTTTVGMDSTVTGGDDVRFFAGNATPSSAPFRVTESGALVATSATITGGITLTSGSFTGSVTISGASGSLAIGTAPPSGPGTGTGIWIDRDAIVGLSGGAQVFTLSSNGIRGFGSDGIQARNAAGQATAMFTDTISGGFLVGHLTSTNTASQTKLNVSATGSDLSETILQIRTANVGKKELRFFNDSAYDVGFMIGEDSAPATSAILELKSTTGALLPSRMTSTQRDALTAVNGMVIYNSTTDKLQVRAAGAWVDLH